MTTDNSLDGEIESFNDMLVMNMTESHYHLPIKDNMFLNYFRYHCSNANFVFKGDDDILIIPENIGYMAKKMEKYDIEKDEILKD